MRLDRYLVERGLAESRAKAKDLIQAGRVRVDGRVVKKPAFDVPEAARVEVEGDKGYVGRGAHKLLGALLTFPVQVEGRVAADVGASTGGFTQVLLEKGARRVYALDVGHGQLHPLLLADPRVVAMERVNARALLHLPEPVELATMDVSFIASTLILPRLFDWLAPEGEALILVKPQFELEPGIHAGVVRDAALRQRAMARVRAAARGLGFVVRGEAESPLPGRAGNREIWLWLQKPPRGDRVALKR